MNILNKGKAVVLAALVLFSVSCKKDDNLGTQGGNTVNLGEIICDIDGVHHIFNSGGGNTYHYDDDYPGSPTGKLIQAGKAENSGGISIFAIDIFHDLDQLVIPTTYTIKPGDIGGTGTYSKELLLSYTNLGGIKWSYDEGADCSLTVTGKTNDIIEGTFSGKLFGPGVININDPFAPMVKDSVMVTNGKFKVQLIRASID